jgi:hypothetical protein
VVIVYTRGGSKQIAVILYTKYCLPVRKTNTEAVRKRVLFDVLKDRCNTRSGLLVPIGYHTKIQRETTQIEGGRIQIPVSVDSYVELVPDIFLEKLLVIR